jgi:hypothetical protein
MQAKITSILIARSTCGFTATQPLVTKRAAWSETISATTAAAEPHGRPASQARALTGAESISSSGL